MKKYEIEINNETYHVSVKELEADADMQISSIQTTQASQQTANPIETENKQTEINTNQQAVKAPMAGSIFKIEVQPGDSVSKGDTLVVLEAMKMENEIVAPEDGVVSEVLVHLNQRVESGQLLLTL